MEGEFNINFSVPMPIQASWIVWLQSHGITEWSVPGGSIAAILLLLYGINRAGRHFPALPGPVQKHPIITMHMIVVTALLAVPPLKEHYPDIWPMVLLFVALLPFFVWRTGYLMLSTRRCHNKIGGFSDHLYYFLPLWDGSNVPYGKGHDYLASRQAIDQAQLTRSRLAGLKLLVLTWLWSGNGLATRIEPYLFYTFIPGLGVYISMLREQARRGKPIVPNAFPMLRTLRRIAGTWLFFGLIRIWDVGAVATLEQQMNSFSSLFGL